LIGTASGIFNGGEGESIMGYSGNFHGGDVEKKDSFFYHALHHCFCRIVHRIAPENSLANESTASYRFFLFSMIIWESLSQISSDSFSLISRALMISMGIVIR
jgi:hypothetical protein